MTTERYAQRQPGAGTSRLGLGATLVALSGVGLVGYGIMFLIRNFTGFIELGLTPQHVGGSPEQIRAFSPDLYGFIIGLGIAVIALAWYGIRRGESWALWTALLSPVIALAVALPLHYLYGIGTLGHLGVIYLDALILLVGIVVAYTGLAQGER